MSKQLQDIHESAKRKFEKIQSAVYDERMQCLEDRRFCFIAGAQWEGNLAKQFENKPKFEINKILLAVIRIFNEYRNNRITVQFLPKEDDHLHDRLADTCNGLYRADEQDSVAEEAYDNAFEEGVSGGFGAWRLRCDYEDHEDDEDERQRVKIEPIFDADSCVFFDLASKRQDKSDAKHCFVLTSMTHEDYEEEYDDCVSSWDRSINQSEFDWSTQDAVYVAEYYEVETVKEVVHIYKTIDGREERYRDSDFEIDEDLKKTLKAIGTRKVREKKIQVNKIHKYLMSGSKILEDCGYIAGNCIPIVPYFGKRSVIDGVERCMGHVRPARDSQRLKNMQMSKLGELAALSSREKPYFLAEQVAGFETEHAEDNIKDYAYLRLNPITDMSGNPMPTGPVAYTKPPMIPPALAALLQSSEQDIQDILGNQQQGEEVQANTSGKAVELVQNRLDMQTFIYVSNMAKAIKRSGEIWLGMARDIFVEEKRKMKTIGAQGEAGIVELKRPVLNEETGEVEYENDFRNVKFDVTVDVGPSSSSKRSATVRALTAMMGITQDPETLQILSSMAMMNMEGEGIEDVRGYFRTKLIKLGVVKPNDQEAKELMEELQNTPPDPNAEYLKSAAQEAQANAAKSVADTQLKLAGVDKTKAETMETLSNIELEHFKSGMELAQNFGGIPDSRPQP